MLQLFYKQKGAITVFLTLILVPIIVVCSCFIDLSRVRLAQGMINSAGDLTMNTAMTSFDTILNEVYGMLASCQSKDDITKNVEEYFKTSLSSQGMEDTEIQEFLKSLNNLLGRAEESADVTDLLCITMEDSSFSLEEVENGNLTNPAVVKEQIVNFVKYRGVIDGIGKLIDMLTNSANATKDVKGDTEIIKAQQDAADKEEKALDALKALYKKTKDYQDKNITDGYINGVVQESKNFRKIYKKVHDFTVKNRLNYSNYDAFGSFKIKDDSTVRNSINVVNVTAGNFRLLLSDLNGALDVYMKYAYKDADSLYSYTTEEEKNIFNSSYKWQYYLQTSKKLIDSNLIKHYVQAVNNLKTAYYKVIDAEELIRLKGKSISDFQDGEGGELTISLSNVYERNGASKAKDWQRKGEKEKTVSQWYQYLTDGNSLYELVRKDFNQASGMYETLKKWVKEGEDKFPEKPPEMSPESMDTQISSVASSLEGIIQQLDDAIEALEKVINKVGSAKEAVENYKNSMQNWNNKASNSNSDLAQKEQGIIEEMSQTEGALYKLLSENPDMLNNFGERVSVLKTNLTTLKAAFENIKYAGSKAVSISRYDSGFGTKFKPKCQSLITGEIPLKEDELDNLCESSFSAGFSGFKKESGEYKLDVDISWLADKNPDLFIDSGLDSEALYHILKKSFENETDNSKKEEYDNYKEQTKSTDKADEAIGIEEDSDSGSSGGEAYPVSVDTQLNEKSDRPSQNAGGSGDGGSTELSSNVDEAGKETDNIFSNIRNKLSNIMLSCRDQLFVTYYIMSMFTYDTYTNEQLYKIATDDDGFHLTLNKLKETKKMLNSPGNYKGKNIGEIWESEDTTKMWNKSLTNQMMNIDNHYSYGNEVEYILYGGKNSTNKLKAYGSIYAIRFALNSIYAIGQFWSVASGDKTALAIEEAAIGISAATMGVVPVPVAKVVLIMALAAAETAYDITCLKSGMPVVFYKDEDSWILDLETLTDFDNDKESNSDGFKLTYSNYLSIFLFTKQISSASADKIYLRTADVIQANMQKRLNRSDGDNAYLLKNSRTYFQLKAKFLVHPLMLKLPIVVNSGLDEGNPKDNKDWYTISYENIRGYY